MPKVKKRVLKNVQKSNKEVTNVNKVKTNFEKYMDFTCPICYKKTLAFRVLELKTCKHALCIFCARRWTEINNSCPICRTPLLECVCSECFYTKTGFYII